MFLGVDLSFYYTGKRGGCSEGLRNEMCDFG